MKHFFHSAYYNLPKHLNSRFVFPCRNFVFEVTYKCNLNCKMCSYLQEIKIKKDEIEYRKELTSDELAGLVRKILFKSNVSFTGGEPFVKKGFLEVLRAAKKKKHKITVGTNGTLLDKATCEEIVALQIDCIGFSLDGPKEVHNGIRGRKDAFEKLFENLRILRRIRQKQNSRYPVILINAVILPDNYKVLPETIQLMQEMGADHISIEAFDASFERSASRLQDHIDPMMNPLGKVPFITKNDFRESLEKTVEAAKNLNIHLDISPPGMTVDDLVKYYRHELNPEQWRCFIPWTTCRISPYGDMFPCMNYRIGNVKNHSLYKLWSSQKYSAFRKLFKKNNIQPCCIGCCKITKAS